MSQMLDSLPPLGALPKNATELLALLSGEGTMVPIWVCIMGVHHGLDFDHLFTFRLQIATT